MSTYEQFCEATAHSLLRCFTYDHAPYSQVWSFGVTAVDGAAHERVAAARGTLTRGCGWLVLLSGAHEDAPITEWLIPAADPACREDTTGISLRFGDESGAAALQRCLEIKFNTAEADRARLDGLLISQQPYHTRRLPAQYRVSPFGIFTATPTGIA